MTPRTGRLTTTAALLMLLAATGCSKPPDTRDQRLVDLAKSSLARQAGQNQQMAEQSKAIVEESRKLAEATQELVAHDAKARRELVAAHNRLTAQLNQQRAAINAARDQLEQERRQIAGQRYRDPLVAAAIQNIGLTIACMLPLVICVFVLRQMNRNEPDDQAVAELLVQELTADQPRLLPRPALRPPALEPAACRRLFVICTCNDISKLPPEFARAERFDGVFFVDLPTAQQRTAIWNIYLRLFELEADQQRPADENWTGAEIRSCCRLAALLDVPLKAAAQNVVPVAVTAAESVERLRSWAGGRCLSADQAGVYAHGAGGKRRRKVVGDPKLN